jgi:sulfate permease, SulP family
MTLSLRVPVFTSLRGYRAGWLRGDVIAGLTVWAVLFLTGLFEDLPEATLGAVASTVKET